jgi:hypothetical protein
LAGANNPFQDVTYTWKFGDTLLSGTSTWANGSNPNGNKRNVATGAIAAHLYLTQGRDAKYTATVTATDGTNTAVCGVGATAFDPNGSNGFPGTATTCISSSGTPVAGSGGCPAGAGALNTSNFNTALTSSLSNKRVLFKCGDTFTGDNATLSGTKWSVGAYGGCENTQSGRPIIRDSGSTGQFTPTGGGDGRIADLDFEGSGSSYAIQTFGGVVTYQMTLYNLLSNGNNESYKYSFGAQWGLVGLVQANTTAIGTFMNYGENNPPYSGNVFNNLDYAALMGSFINGVGPTPGNNNGIETVRISSCRLCVIANNTIQNANGVGAVLKFHEGNTNDSCSTQAQPPTTGCRPPCVVGTNIDGNGIHRGGIFATTSCWVGVFTELIEISDNLFTGNSGSNLVEFLPQNAGADERMRLAVVERNFFTSTTGPADGRDLLVAAVNSTVRDNIFFVPSSHPNAPFAGIQIAQRGVEPVPQFVELYNNTCYFLTNQSGQYCGGFDGNNFSAPGINSFSKNNLFFAVGGGHNTITDNGTGNAVSNNTANGSNTNNPSMTNGSGTFSLISDFKPTANFTGGTSVPVVNDALGIQWSPTWDFGAVHH